MELVAQGRELLSTSQAEECIALLLPEAEKNPDNVPLLQLLGEAYLEVGNPQNAYALFDKSAQLDPEGKVGGVEKFLWLGQLAGDRPGISWFEKGVQGLRAKLSSGGEAQEEASWLRKKLAEALCGMIEIWMTDLCMEPEAEEMCDKLITEAIMVDDSIAESYSVLGSIRISQQRNEDALKALQKSWELYESQLAVGGAAADDIPALVRLAQSLIEVGGHELVLDITTTVNSADDAVAEAYYLNALAHQELRSKTEGRTANRHIAGARDACKLLLELTQREDASVDPDLVEAVSEMLRSLPEVNDDDYSDSDESEWEGIDD
uniref:ARAD1A07414p n=1 Tax=Blastobotrys adeninivorans TaxID=409370 RepID=A0A060SX88_BLAAD